MTDNEENRKSLRISSNYQKKKRRKQATTVVIDDEKNLSDLTNQNDTNSHASHSSSPGEFDEELGDNYYSTQSTYSTDDATASDQDLKTIHQIHHVLNRFKNQKSLAPKATINLNIHEIKFVCDEYLGIIKNEKALLRLKTENCGFTIIGDIHGQYNDIWNIVSLSYQTGKEHECNMKYLFLGDYVDRGPNSLETIMLLMCWKVLASEEIYLLRGNHEHRDICSRYGFLSELKRRFNPAQAMRIFGYINHCFEYMAIAAVLNDKYFAVHGGLSPGLNSIEDIEELQFPICVASNRLVNDLLWADPNSHVANFDKNPLRGPKFGPEAVSSFFDNNSGIDKILRAHQFIREGVKSNFDGQVLTIFSAPNYRQTNNTGGILLIFEDGSEQTIFIPPSDGND